VKESLRKTTLRTFGTTGVFEQDDSENWAEVTRMLAGHMARATPLNIGLGLGQSSDPDGQAPGTTDFVLSEAAARSFYGRWARLSRRGLPRRGCRRRKACYEPAARDCARF
jgi:hypothetical protein